MVGLAAFLVYLRLCPSITGDGDSAELALVLAFNGVAHPTGYPLYTLLGHAFASLLHGLGTSWPLAANAWSALGAGVAIGLLHALGARLVPAAARLGRGARAGLALAPVALLAFNPVWTRDATLAEVYSWHVAWVTGAALFFVTRVRALAAREPVPAGRVYADAVAWGLLCGLGAAHHATSVLVSAPLSVALLVVLRARRRLRAGAVLAALGAALVPLSAYGYVYWRGFHPAPVQWPDYIPGWQGFLYHVTGQQYRTLLGFFLPSPEQQRLLAAQVYPLLVPALALLLVAAARARDLAARATRWGLLAAALAGVAHVFAYGVHDPASYFHAPLALGCLALPLLGGEWLGSPAASRRAAWAAGAVFALGAVALWVPWLGEARGRARNWAAADHRVRELWRTIPVDSAVVFWPSDALYKLRAYQLLDGERPGLEVQHPLNLVGSRERLRYLEQYGFDPTEGMPVWSAADAAGSRAGERIAFATRLIVANVNRHRRVPVVLFDPAIPAIRVLEKPDSGVVR